MLRKEDLIKKLKELKKQANQEKEENCDDNLIINFNNGVLWTIKQLEMELGLND